jgi:Tfp pilus assembly protein PilF
MSLTNFGAVCKILNRPDEARRSFERALEKDPNYRPARASLDELSATPPR